VTEAKGGRTGESQSTDAQRTIPYHRRPGKGRAYRREQFAPLQAEAREHGAAVEHHQLVAALANPMESKCYLESRPGLGKRDERSGVRRAQHGLEARRCCREVVAVLCLDGQCEEPCR
jgi:hypothetical protein